ncbi:hypothetical protein ACJX0J_036044, partial [Zea mays]
LSPENLISVQFWLASDIGVSCLEILHASLLKAQNLGGEEEYCTSLHAINTSFFLILLYGKKHYFPFHQKLLVKKLGQNYLPLLPMTTFLNKPRFFSKQELILV